MTHTDQSRAEFEAWYSEYHNDACDNYGGIDCTNPKGVAEDAWQAALNYAIAIIPGWHCHVVFANDKDTLDFHEKHAKHLRAKLSERSPKPTDEAD